MIEVVNKCHIGDCRETMRRLEEQGKRVKMCVTSPPYWGLRDYGHSDQLGLESTIDEYIANMVEVFRCVWDLLADDGTLWLNMGDCYNGYMANHRGTGLETKRQQSRKYIEPGAGLRSTQVKNKDLIGQPWRLAFALQADGWYLRQDIIWHKPNPMPESVRDRCTKSHEYIFLFSKSERYYFDQEAIKEPATFGEPNSPQSIKSPHGQGFTRRSGNKARKDSSERGCPENSQSNVCGSVPWEGSTRNKRSVWSVATTPFSGAHFATFPTKLIEPCILAGSRGGDVVIDPFFGSGTTGQVCESLGRRWIGCELNPEYSVLQDERIRQKGLLL